MSYESDIYKLHHCSINKRWEIVHAKGHVTPRTITLLVRDSAWGYRTRIEELSDTPQKAVDRTVSLLQQELRIAEQRVAYLREKLDSVPALNDIPTREAGEQFKPSTTENK